MRVLFLISLMVYAVGLWGQDYHLAQFDANGLRLNPALTGERMLAGKGLQCNLNYRDQIGNYSGNTGSFKTTVLSLDQVVKKQFSVGGFVENSKSVNNSFNTTQFAVSGAYNLLGRSEVHKQNLSVGLQLGIINSSVDFQGRTYDAQYSPTSATGFDNNIPSGENFFRSSVASINGNFGLYYRNHFTEKITAFGGASIFHFTQPKLAFSNQSKLPIKYTIHGGFTWKLDGKLMLQPQFIVMMQAKAYEVNAGSLLHYHVNDNFSLITGYNYRYQNASIFQAGVRAKEYTIRMSYCFGVGNLANYRNRGIEFSLVYLRGK